ncbi:hypothetical protein J6590_064342 [Homalodisca vitripennis]|nr:hypothetical protein J6590_064342 [Homalodisca vitripennis]
MSHVDDRAQISELLKSPDISCNIDFHLLSGVVRGATVLLLQWGSDSCSYQALEAMSVQETSLSLLHRHHFSFVQSVFVRPGDGAGRALPGGTGLSGTTECPALRPGEADPVPSARQQYTAVRSAVHCLRLQRERLVTYTATETSCQTIEGEPNLITSLERSTYGFVWFMRAKAPELESFEMFKTLL